LLSVANRAKSPSSRVNPIETVFILTPVYLRLRKITCKTNPIMA